jgi:FtsZ-interacting cell division protein ZipA
MKNLILSIAGIVCIIAIIYGAYWIAKTVSYQVFYEDMVKQTVRDMVKPEYLKRNQ